VRWGAADLAAEKVERPGRRLFPAKTARTVQSPIAHVEFPYRHRVHGPEKAGGVGIVPGV
jgi:hypothetical protein